MYPTEPITTPVRVFQLVHPELRRDFPVLQSLDAFSGNLPVQATSFVGREQEIIAIEPRWRDLGW